MKILNNRIHNQILNSVDRKKNDRHIIHTEGEYNEKNSFKTAKLKQDFAIIKEDDEYKITLTKLRFPLKITNFMTKINTSKNNQLKSLTERTPVVDSSCVKKSRNDRKNKNLGMNLTFTEKSYTNTNKYSHSRDTSDPDNHRSTTQSKTSKQKKLNNESLTSNNKTNTPIDKLKSLTPKLLVTKENIDSKSLKKTAIKKTDSNTSGNNNTSNIKTVSDNIINDGNTTNANYLDTMHSQDASSSSSRRNSFNVNPSYLHYFKEKKKKINNIYKVPDNKKGNSVNNNQHPIAKSKPIMDLSIYAVQLIVIQIHFEMKFSR